MKHDMTAAILHDMTEGVMVIGEDNIIQYLNPMGKLILEYAGELEGLPYGQFFGGDAQNGEFHQFILDAVYDKSKTHSGSVPYKTSATGQKTLKISTSFIFNEQRDRKIGIAIVFSDITELERLARLRGTFGKYVDSNLVDTLIANDETGGSTGEKRHTAVLFADIRGFTAMSEALRGEPETLVEILNKYLDLSAGIVFQNGGSIDKFVGDAVMALFNGFTRLDDYVYKAVKAAWEIVRGADELNLFVKERYGINIGFGVGVHCGEAIVGDLGTSFRKDYTAIGDTVNTAARLESRAGSGQVLISRAVLDELHASAKHTRVEVEPIGELQLKGKSRGVEVFSVAGCVTG